MKRGWGMWVIGVVMIGAVLLGFVGSAMAQQRFDCQGDRDPVLGAAGVVHGPVQAEAPGVREADRDQGRGRGLPDRAVPAKDRGRDGCEEPDRPPHQDLDILALLRPGVASAGTIPLIFAGKPVLFPLIRAEGSTKALPVVVYNFMTFEELDLGGVYAAATLITLPVLVMVLLVQRQFVRGLTIGA